MQERRDQHFYEEPIKVFQDYRYGTVNVYPSDWDHVTEHHPPMKRNMAAIIDTISDPDLVTPGPDYPNRQSFYKHSACATYYDRFTTKAVVEYDNAAWTNGYLVTAFPVKEAEECDKPIYVRPEKDDL